MIHISPQLELVSINAPKAWTLGSYVNLIFLTTYNGSINGTQKVVKFIVKISQSTWLLPSIFGNLWPWTIQFCNCFLQLLWIYLNNISLLSPSLSEPTHMAAQIVSVTNWLHDNHIVVFISHMYNVKNEAVHFTLLL